MLKKVLLTIKMISMCLCSSLTYAKGILTLLFKNELTEGNRFAGYAGHKGTDWLCNIISLILAAADGIVSAYDGGYPNADPDNDGTPTDGDGYGNWLIINHRVVNG